MKDTERSDITPQNTAQSCGITPQFSITMVRAESVGSANGPTHHEACQKARTALYCLLKHYVLHEPVYSFKKKDQATLCKSNIIETCFGGHSVFYSRTWRRREMEGSVPCPTRSHRTQGTLWLLTGTSSAATGFRQAANGARSQRQPSW